MSTDFENIKKQLLLPKKKPPKESPKDFLSTGSTLLNLACSGRIDGGLRKGSYVFFVGDSASGKTFLSLACLAEAAHNKHFKDYQLVYDPVEGGALMDMEKFFGSALAKRIQPPSKHSNRSRSTEEFYYNVDDAAKSGPVVYILDSMDALETEDDNKKFQQHKKASRKKAKAETNGESDKEEKVAGSYGTAKAKLNSTYLRKARNAMEDTGSILIVISQTRDNLGFGFEKKTRSGGRALRFYATTECWFSIKENIKKTVMGKPRKIGTVLRIQVKKNRQTGMEPTIDVPFFPSVGVDDIGSCVNFLMEEGHWTKEGKRGIAAPEFHFSGAEEKLIRMIEEKNLEGELKEIVGKVWGEIEEGCRVERKPRYS